MTSGSRDEEAGRVREVSGAAKEKAGKLLGDPYLAAEGKIEKVAGKVQKKIGQVKKVLGR